jgi:hypothetical protein
VEAAKKQSQIPTGRRTLLTNASWWFAAGGGQSWLSAQGNTMTG